MVVIDKINLESFYKAKSAIQDQLDANFVDIVPIEILNDQYILPNVCLTDEIFKQIFDNFKDYTIRDVEASEFKKIEL